MKGKYPRGEGGRLFWLARPAQIDLRDSAGVSTYGLLRMKNPLKELTKIPRFAKVRRTIRRARARRPRICMIVHSQFPVGEPRGERHARALSEAGYEVHVICLRLPGQPRVDRLDDIRITRLPIRHLRGVSRFRLAGEYLAFAIGAAVAALPLPGRPAIDVVYVHAPPDFLVLAALLPRLRGAKVILDVHDLTPHMYEARFGGRRGAHLVQSVLELTERRACAIADRVVTVHEPYRDELVANGVDPAKIAIVMNSPDEGEIELAAKSPAGDSDAFVIAYHGTITHWYGVDLVVRAIARLDHRIPGIEGVILGEGDTLSETEKLATELGVEDRIEFSRRYVSHLEALTAAARASCGVIPNRRSHLNRFALSSKLLEYVALGVPVVVSRLETLAAHFSSEEVTFFEPDDDEALAEAIAWVAKHPQEAEAKAERARQRAEAYSWHTSRDRLLDAVSPAAGRTIGDVAPPASD
jgi:glycosyltransferase involved in cell wall biosynthesis